MRLGLAWAPAYILVTPLASKCSQPFSPAEGTRRWTWMTRTFPVTCRPPKELQGYR